MSRISKEPVQIPSGVEVSITEAGIAAKGAAGQVSMALHPWVGVEREQDVLRFASRRPGHQPATAMAGTMRALAANVVKGAKEGFERRLQLVGVGYRAQAQGRTLNLTLGFSHPVNYAVPEGITVETPSATEIVVKGADKQRVGQVAAELRAYRPPEPYKGKGIRYADERVVLKEAKKK